MSDLSEIVPEWRNLSLEDITERLARLPKDARDEIVNAAAQFSAGMRWIPSTGPQQDAYFCAADLLLYGGSGGSGKSDLLLGLAASAHKKSLIMRSQFNDLDALTERSIEINGTKVGYNGSPPPSLRTVDGRFIQFTGAAVDKWQGQPFDLKCVGADTLVWMADGTKKRVEDIRVGDCVHTVDGPHRVTRIFPPKRSAAVMAVAFDADGTEIGSQIQGRDHRLLTKRGWVSHDTFCGARPFSTFAQIAVRAALQLFSPWPPSSEISSQYLGFQWSGRQRKELWLSQVLGRIRRMASGASWAPLSMATNSAQSGGSRLVCLPLQECLTTNKPDREHDLVSYYRRLFAWQKSAHVGRDALILSSPADFLDDYQSEYDLCDGRARYPASCPELEDVLICLQRSTYAGGPTHVYSPSYGQDNTPTRTRELGRYVHPYRKEICRSDQQVSICSLKLYPVGIQTLFDFEVEGSNSYISDRGFVSSNCFDEGAQIPESVIKFHLGWIRSADPNQRTRAVIATNPPVNSQGDYLIRLFRPWLDITHERPAAAGELRWFVKDPDGADFEVPDNTPYQFPGREDVLLPQSRTFIPGKLKDNPYLARTNYQATLDSLEEPLRSAIRDGNFMASRADQEFQVIPTEWILLANKRWTPQRPDYQMTAIGVDVGAGGIDRVVLAPRYAEYYDRLVVASGKDAPDGSTQAALIVRHRRDACGVVVDVGGGYGGDCCGRLKENGIEPVRFDGSSGSTARTKDGSKRIFENKRAEAWWRFREALDPDQAGGSIVALPDDPELRAELSSVRFIPDVAKIQIEKKTEVKKRLGRSPDKADAVVMAWSPGDVAVRRVRYGGGPAGAYERSDRANIGYGQIKSTFRG